MWNAKWAGVLQHIGQDSGFYTHFPASEQRRQAREYDDYLRQKVEAGRASMRAGRGRSNDEVEAEFAARRNSDCG
jgi:hypothetical protein